MGLEEQGWVEKHSPLTGNQYSVHYCIATIVNPKHNHEFWLLQVKLARYARVSVDTVQRAISALLDHDPPLLALVEDNSRDGTTTANVYRLLMPDDVALYYDPDTQSGEPGTALTRAGRRRREAAGMEP